MKKKNIALMMATAVAASAAAMPVSASDFTAWVYDDINVVTLQAAVDEYKKDHPDFNCEITKVNGEDLDLRVTTAEASGDYSTLPDIMIFQDSAFQKHLSSYPDIFYDLTDSGIDFSQFASGKVANSVVDGRNYAVPFDNGIVISAYRTDFLEEAGYTIDDLTDITWDRFLEIARDVKEKTGLPMLSAKAGDPQIIYIMMGSLGLSFFDEEDNVHISDSEDVKMATQLYIDMVNEGLLLETPDWEQYYATFANGTVVGTLNGCWITGNLTAAEDQTGNWGVTNIPKFDVENGTNYSKNGGSSWVISGNCENAEEAAAFLKDTFSGQYSEAVYTAALSQGGVATYLPAAEYDIYKTPVEFFGGDTVYQKFMNFAESMPSAKTGAYYYNCITALGVATSEVIQNGADLDEALQIAQETVEFDMEG